MQDIFNTLAKTTTQFFRPRKNVEDLVPQARNQINLVITRTNGDVETSVTYNTRTNAGALWQAGIMGNASGNPANWIALSTVTLTPAEGDTTLTGEITAGTDAGLVRTQGSFTNYVAPSVVGGPASYDIVYTFTAEHNTTVLSAAMFDASTGGNLFVEANLSVPATLASGDSVKITWTVQI